MTCQEVRQPWQPGPSPEMARLEEKLARYETALEAARAELERFAYMASHDLRAPLRPLMTVPEWIRETLTERYGEVDGEIEVDLTEMETQSRRMDRLLTDLLTFSRIGRGKEPMQALNPAALIADGALLEEVPATFKVDIAPDLPDVDSTPTELSLLLGNLISNAVKHHDAGSGRIEITGMSDADGARITVTDDGPGIDEAFTERVFDMFTTLRPRDEVEGSGLGLAIVRKIMDRIGGEVRLSTAPSGHGASFTLLFPKTFSDKAIAP